MQEDSNDGQLTPHEVADRAGCTPQTVNKLFRDGKIDGNRISPRRSLFDPAVIPKVQLLLSKNGKDGPVRRDSVSYSDLPEAKVKKRTYRKKAQSETISDEEVEAYFNAGTAKARRIGRTAEKRFLLKLAAEAANAEGPGAQALELKVLRYLVDPSKTTTTN